MSLQDKSLVELRGIAQSFGIDNIFSKTDIELRQAIELHQANMSPEVPLPTQPAYDARLMTEMPSDVSARDEVKVLLQPFVDLGLHLSFPNDEEWHMRYSDREDTGTMRQPLRNILQCAEKLMKTSKNVVRSQ